MNRAIVIHFYNWGIRLNEVSRNNVTNLLKMVLASFVSCTGLSRSFFGLENPVREQKPLPLGDLVYETFWLHPISQGCDSGPCSEQSDLE
jgi:hypothetical protein